jgi:hypothetical protein
MRKLELNIQFYRKKSRAKYVKSNENSITLLPTKTDINDLTLVLENQNGYKWTYPVSNLTTKAVCFNLDGFETISFWVERPVYGPNQSIELMIA